MFILKLGWQRFLSLCHKSIKEFRKKTGGYSGYIGVEEETVDRYITGPIYYGKGFKKIEDSAANFKSNEMKEVFLDEIIFTFMEPIDFTSPTELIIIEKESDFEILHTMRIYKSRVFDLLQKTNGSYMLCVDVYNKFKDGELVISRDAPYIII